MAYQAWSVVFGEQPTASKWNILGTNDASFHDGTGIDDDAIIARHIANLAVSNPQMAADTWLWEKLYDSGELGGSAASISSGTITARKFLRVFMYAVATGGTLNTRLRFNNDSGANYAERSSSNGGADGTGASGVNVGFTQSASTNSRIGVAEITNTSAQEKLVSIHIVENNGAGAANVPTRAEEAAKWANTSVQITRVDLINTGTGSFAAGSRLIVLGHD